jgi:hypothetical protein
VFLTLTQLNPDDIAEGFTVTILLGIDPAAM